MTSLTDSGENYNDEEGAKLLYSVAAAAAAAALERETSSSDDADKNARMKRTGDNSAVPKQQTKQRTINKRMCRFPNCTRVIKSQGHCQRHGAKAKRCQVKGCDKQAQGTHGGMCKRHWHDLHESDSVPIRTAPTLPPNPPKGASVYDTILPLSIGYRPVRTNKATDETAPPPPVLLAVDPWNPPPPPEGASVMPLVSFINDGAGRERAWHRNRERRMRSLLFVAHMDQPFDPWESQLVLIEILLMGGGTPYANFQNLAHAWGRERGFHMTLVNSVCEVRGEAERKCQGEEQQQQQQQKQQQLNAAEENNNLQPYKRHKRDENNEHDARGTDVAMLDQGGGNSLLADGQYNNDEYAQYPLQYNAV